MFIRHYIITSIYQYIMTFINKYVTTSLHTNSRLAIKSAIAKYLCYCILAIWHGYGIIYLGGHSLSHLRSNLILFSLYPPIRLYLFDPPNDWDSLFITISEICEISNTHFFLFSFPL